MHNPPRYTPNADVPIAAPIGWQIWVGPDLCANDRASFEVLDRRTAEKDLFEAFNEHGPDDLRLVPIYAGDVEDATMVTESGDYPLTEQAEGLAQKVQPETYGYRLDERAAFERAASEGLKRRAYATAPHEGFSWVVWDPADGVDGVLIVGQSRAQVLEEFQLVAAAFDL